MWPFPAREDRASVSTNTPTAYSSVVEGNSIPKHIGQCSATPQSEIGRGSRGPADGQVHFLLPYHFGTQRKTSKGNHHKGMKSLPTYKWMAHKVCPDSRDDPDL